MGYKFLQQYVKRNGSLFSRVDVPKNTDIVVDGDALLYYLFIQSQNFSYGGDTERLHTAAARFFEGLARFAIRPVVFLPISTTEQINQTKMQAYAELVEQLTNDPLAQINRAARGFRFPIVLRLAFVQILKDIKVDFLCVAGEVPPYAAQYAHEHKIPVLGYDSVYLGYDIEFCFIESLYFEDEQQTNKNAKQYEIRDAVSCQHSEGVKIAEHLKLNFEQYQFLLTVLPNDYMTELNELRASMEHGTTGRDAKDLMIENLAQFILDNWGTDGKGLTKAIIAKQQECVAAENKLKEQNRTAMQEKIAAAKVQIKKLGEQEVSEYTKSSIADQEKSIIILTEELNSITADVHVDVALIEKQLQEGKKLFELKKHQDSIPVFQGLPKWIQSFFKFGKLPVYLYQALTEGAATFLPFIEKVDAAASSDAGKELRKMLYSIMNIKTVKESHRQGLEMKEDVLAIGKSPVDLQGAVKLSVDERKLLVLKLVLGDEQQAKKLLETTENANKLIISAALLYLAKHAKPETPAFMALLTAQLFPHKDSYVAKQLSINQIPRQMDMMTVLAQYQNIIEPICALNNLFGQPIAAEYDKILCSPQILIQYQHEMEKESPVFYHRNVFTSGDVPDDFNCYANKQKTSQKLTKQEMQLAEHVANIPLAAMLVGAAGFTEAIETLTAVEQDDQIVKEWEERQEKKLRSRDLMLAKGNKFGALEQDE